MIGHIGQMRMEWGPWLLRNRQVLDPASAVAATVWMGLICDFSYIVGENATRPSDSGTVSWPGDWLGVPYSIRYWLGDAGEDWAYVQRYRWCDSQPCTGFPKGSTSHLLTGV